MASDVDRIFKLFENLYFNNSADAEKLLGKIIYFVMTQFSYPLYDFSGEIKVEESTDECFLDNHGNILLRALFTSCLTIIRKNTNKYTRIYSQTYKNRVFQLKIATNLLAKTKSSRVIFAENNIIAMREYLKPTDHLYLPYGISRRTIENNLQKSMAFYKIDESSILEMSKKSLNVKYLDNFQIVSKSSGNCLGNKKLQTMSGTLTVNFIFHHRQPLQLSDSKLFYSYRINLLTGDRYCAEFVKITKAQSLKCQDLVDNCMPVLF